MSEPDGAVGRLISEIVVGGPVDARAREKRDDDMALKEVELQFQIRILDGSIASAIIGWTAIQVNFPYELMYADGQRDSSLAFPHFTFGAHATPPQAVQAVVREWLRNEASGAITGAIVAVGAIGEGSYTGWVHLTFQGYAAPLSVVA